MFPRKSGSLWAGLHCRRSGAPAFLLEGSTAAGITRNSHPP